MKKIVCLLFLVVFFVGTAYPQANVDNRTPLGRIVRDTYHGVPVMAWYDSLTGIIYNVTPLNPLPTKPIIGYNHTLIKDTVLVTNYYKTITIGTSDVNGLVSIFTSSSSDSIYVGFNGDTASTQRSLVPGNLIARQYYRKFKSISLKGNSALTAHVEVEY